MPKLTIILILAIMMPMPSMGCANIDAKAAAKPATRPEAVDFELLETVNLMSGGRYGAILLAEGTPSASVELTARKAAKEHLLTEIDVYCSRLALKANFSAAIDKANPGERARCHIASLNGAHFKTFPGR